MALLPYCDLVLDPEDAAGPLRPGAWLRGIEDGFREIGSSDGLVGAWDHASRLKLHRSVAYDRNAILEQCLLPGNAQLQLSCWWTTAFRRGRSSGRRVVGRPRTFTLENPAGEIALTLELPGAEVAGEIELVTSLNLATSLPAGGVHASRPGSRLWQEVRKVPLEGEGSRMPVCMIDFSTQPVRFGGARAAWCVEIADDALLQPVSGGVVVYLNSAHRELFGREEEPTPLKAQVLRAMQVDVARRLLEVALSDPEFLAGETYPEDALGTGLQGLIRRAFPGTTDLGSVANLLNNQRARFEATLQHHLDITGSGGKP